MFELSLVDADVPALAGLCAGAIACGRSRGLPAFERFARLATGVYAGPTQLRTKRRELAELGQQSLGASQTG